MRIFLTGATGFIGTHLVRRLAQTEHEMVCLVRETSDVSTLEEVGATLVRGDVTDKDSVLEGMRGCDWVANLANVYSFWEPDKRVYTEVNVEGTRNVMECALEMGVTKVVHVSTMATYGKPADVPFVEESAAGPVSPRLTSIRPVPGLHAGGRAPSSARRRPSGALPAGPPIPEPWRTA